MYRLGYYSPDADEVCLVVVKTKEEAKKMYKKTA